MKNRTLITLGVALAILVFAPMAVTAQSDTAELTLTGTVPSIVKIGFTNTGTAAATLNLGDLTDNTDDGTPPSLVYAANVAFDLTVSSANSGEAATAGVTAVLTNNATVSGFRNVVTYQIDVAGQTDVDLSAGTVNLLTGEPAGVGSYSITVTPELIDLSSFDENSTLSNVNAQGTYQDTLTFTITAAP